jgi:hypothetical protein
VGAPILRRKTHSSHGDRKAYLNFELKDAPKARGLWPSQILDFKVQIRSGLPCDEWEGVAGAAAFCICTRMHDGTIHITFYLDNVDHEGSPEDRSEKSNPR